VSLELPLVVIDIQRGGPSTGLPTKTEASDLLQAMYGRHGESPVPVVAARSPSHCFAAAIEAARIALRYRTPVILLSDGYLANGSEPWRLPDVADLPDISVPFATEPNHTGPDGEAVFWPYLRDPETLARPWAVPGTPGLEHRIGGLEKEDGSGNISYEPSNHELMTERRAAKVAGIAHDIAPVTLTGAVACPRTRNPLPMICCDVAVTSGMEAISGRKASAVRNWLRWLVARCSTTSRPASSGSSATGSRLGASTVTWAMSPTVRCTRNTASPPISALMKMKTKTPTATPATSNPVCALVAVR